MNLELVEITLGLMLIGVPEYEEREKIQQSLLEKLNREIRIGTWQTFGMHTFEDIKTDLYYQLFLKRPYSVKEFDYSLFSFETFEETKVVSVVYFFEFDRDVLQTNEEIVEFLQADEEIMESALKEIQRKTERFCYRSLVIGGLKNIHFSIRCDNKAKWDLAFYCAKTN